MVEALGVYVSVPFCRAKCTYCNFASGVFGMERMDAYVARVCGEIAEARGEAARAGAELPSRVDTVYFGGGTPSLLGAEQVERIFGALRGEFAVEADAEITLECAPGQLSEETLAALLREGMNRVSFGVQSFVDREARAVGRMHTREMCVAEIERMRTAGVSNVSVDLIVGLPHQTAESWSESVDTLIATGVSHASVYMLEVDEDSRLGKEMLAEGGRYGAGETPSDDAVAEWYGEGCTRLEGAGLQQYEISNFARSGRMSRHNRKYWRREPYIGFGLDAHTMVRVGPEEAVRWANGDDLEEYIGQGDSATEREEVLPLWRAGGRRVDAVGVLKSFEETLFLGLRMNEGIALEPLRQRYGAGLVDGVLVRLADTMEAGLTEEGNGRVRLTSAGRMVSNEVFGRVLAAG